MFKVLSRPFIAPSLLAMAIGCAPAQAQTPAEPAAKTIEPGVDASIKPGDDFFAFANGAWLKANDIPAGKPRLIVRDELATLTRAQVVKLVDDASTAPAGSTGRKVADFRAAWLNEAAIEAKGTTPIKPMLDRIDRVNDKRALTKLLGSGVRADADPMNLAVYRSAHLIGLAVQPSIHGEKNYAAFLLQGGLGLPSREHYLSADPAMRAARTRYQEAIASVLMTAGFDHAPSASQRAEAVMALETAIAQSHATHEVSDNERNADNQWTRADFARQAPGMDWPEFFAAAGVARQVSFVAWQPSAMKGAAALIGSQPLQTWKDYLRVRVIATYADVLPHAFADQALALRGEGAVGQRQAPRAERATDVTLLAMSEAIGNLYAERHFTAAHKARVQTILANVNAAFSRRVEAVTWMSAESKAVALAKLKAMYFGLGYPEKWKGMSDLAMDPTDAVGNVQRLSERQYRQTLSRLGKPVDHTEWSIAPQLIGGVLMFQQNSYNFSAALMQLSKFDLAASDAANYGAIGAIIGHEMSHTVDTLGAEYEVNGRARRWWTPEDIARHMAASAPLASQYNGYQPLPDVAVNGKQTLNENTADLCGLNSAFDAYRATLGDKVHDKAYVHQQDRQFFIAFARSWRGKYREEALRKQLATDNHAPENYRIATVRNLDAWYEAFNVLPGQQLYLEPAARVRIW
ncbi:MAG: M13 family metallopeptidase [Pseudomonadota bacterium]